MMTAAELITELRKYRSDAPINLVVATATRVEYAHLTYITVASVDVRSDHLRTSDGVALFLSNTKEI